MIRGEVWITKVGSTTNIVLSQLNNYGETGAQMGKEAWRHEVKGGRCGVTGPGVLLLFPPHFPSGSNT